MNDTLFDIRGRRVLTPSFLRRLNQANRACRVLRSRGYRILEVDVRTGECDVPNFIEVDGGRVNERFSIDGCVITRRLAHVDSRLKGRIEALARRLGDTA